MNKQQAYAWGVFCSFFSAFIWGTSHISGRWLMSNRYIDAISLCSIRYTIGGLILLFMGLLFHRKRILAVTFRDLLILSWLGFLGMVIHTTLLLVGQGHTTAINASLILALNPIMAMFIALFLGHRIGTTKAAGMALSLLGCLMVIGVIGKNGFNYNSANLYGDAMILASAVFWALYVVFSAKTVTRLGGFTATTWSMLAGAVQFLLLQFFWPVETHVPALGESTQWLVIIYVILFPTAAGFYFWYEAMSRIKLSLLNIMQYLTPIATIVLSYFILDERMTFFNIIGAVLTLFGVMVASKMIKLPKLLGSYTQKLCRVQPEN
jgi:drug/metabolite transporter (DMT)-like permease